MYILHYDILHFVTWTLPKVEFLFPLLFFLFIKHQVQLFMRDQEWVSCWINSLIHHYEHNNNGLVEAVSTLLHTRKVTSILKGTFQ